MNTPDMINLSLQTNPHSRVREPVVDAIQITEKIESESSEFPTYKVMVSGIKHDFILKTYPFEESRPAKEYFSEIRYVNLRHKNILHLKRFAEEVILTENRIEKNISLILMDSYMFSLKDLLHKYQIFRDEKLARSFFHNLIEGLEFLHESGIAHMNLSIDDLVVGYDMQLKIKNFARSYQKNDLFLQSSGIKNFRAPELKAGKNVNPYKCDIYSAGIILFSLLTGELPYEEDSKTSLWTLLMDSPYEFWIKYDDINSEISNFSSDFRDLFFELVDIDSKTRADFGTIKKCQWYNKEIYNPYEIKLIIDHMVDEYQEL